MNKPQAEGNVNSRLYSRGRSSNKLHEEYDAWEESSTLFSNKKIKQVCHFCLTWRSIYDVLTQISNDFQWSLWRFQCRQTLAVAARRGTTTVASGVDKPSFVPQTFSSFVFYTPSLSFCGRSAQLMSVMCTERSLLCIMSRHAPYCWLATSLFWYSAWLSFLKCFWKNTYPTFNYCRFV